MPMTERRERRHEDQFPLSSVDGRCGSGPAARPRRDERRESERKPGVQGGRGELPHGVVSRPSLKPW
jgi:hypothetical protein